MTIGVLEMDFLIPGARSLKDKRRVLKGLKQRIRDRFNCSVAETEYHDLWNRARLTACVVANESRHADSQITEIANFAQGRFDAELVDYRTELL